MLNFMKDFEPQCYALLRIITGFLFLFHGTNYLLGWPNPRDISEAAWYMQFLGAPILTFGGLLVCIGLFTRPAAFLSSGMMAFAYWMVYGPRAFNPPEGSTNSFIELMLPMINRGELATMFCFAFLYIAARGSGIWSIDAKRGASD